MLVLGYAAIPRSGGVGNGGEIKEELRCGSTMIYYVT